MSELEIAIYMILGCLCIYVLSVILWIVNIYICMRIDSEKYNYQCGFTVRNLLDETYDTITYVPVVNTIVAIVFFITRVYAYICKFTGLAWLKNKIGPTLSKFWNKFLDIKIYQEKKQ